MTTPANRPQGNGLRRLFAALLSVVLLAASCTDSPEAADDGVVPVEDPDATPNSADRWIVWARCEQVIFQTDEELDAWRDRGADGFVCQAGDLVGIGGARDFSGTAEPLAGAGFDLQRQIVNTDIVERAKARDLDLYLGMFAVNRGQSEPTPFADWFADETWEDDVLPAIERFAASARALGFAGLAIDQEMYPLNDGQLATWDWDYAGSDESEASVRAQVRARGEDVMTRLVGGFPDAELLAYYTYFPDTFASVVQRRVNDIDDAYGESVQVEFWDGMSGVEGYEAITLLNALFYKVPHIGSWDSALRYQYNALFALLSREFTNWDVAHDRFNESPFAWVSDGETSFEVARSPDDVDDQLRAFAEWGMNRTSANYAFGDTLTEFDYSDYEAGSRSASSAAVVDGTPPALTVDDPEVDGSTATVTGTATDDHAVHYVRWENERGDRGIARMEFEILDGDIDTDFTFEMRWRIDGIPTDGGPVVIEVADIKGLRTTEVVGVSDADG